MQHPDSWSALHLYVVRLQAGANLSHRQAFEVLRGQGIGVNLHYIPVHTQPYYAQMGFRQGDFPEAERYYLEAISLPMYPTLGGANQDAVAFALRKVFS
jgi:dTDP-4-amino-4,6-dideoxygalactose transaminase